MCTRPLVSLNDIIHCPEVWIEDSVFETVRNHLEGNGASCEEISPVPGFRRMRVRNSKGNSYDRNNIRLFLEAHEEWDLIGFADACAIRDSASRQGQQGGQH